MARSTTNRTGWWYFSDSSKIWQDTAGTSAITTDGQTIKRADDQQSSNNLTEATNGPTWESPSNFLLPAASFDGTNDELAGPAISTLFGSQAKTLLMAVRFRAAFTNNANLFANTGPVSDSNAYWGIHGKSNAGVHTLYHYNWDGNEDGNSTGQTISLDTNYIVCMRHDTSNIYLSINGGSETSQASGATSVMTGLLKLSRTHGGGDRWLNCEIGEVATYNAAITGSALSDTIAAMMADWVTAPPSGYTLTADAGSFSLSGQAAGLRAGRRIAGDAGAFALTGQTAGLRVSRKLIAEAGAFALSGQDATLNRGRRLTAEPGAFTLAGQDASLRRGTRLAADPGAFTLTGQAAGLRRAARLTAGAGAFSLAGQDATLTYSGVSTPGGICQSVSMVPTIQQAVEMGAIISQRAKLLPSIQQQVNMGCGNCGN